MYKFKAYINGKFIDSEEKVTIFSPETNEAVGTVPSLSKETINEAFLVAKFAQIKWELTPKKERCELLLKYSNILLEHKEEIAKIMVSEIGKAYNACVKEVETAAKYITTAIKWYTDEKDKFLFEKDHGVKGKIVHLMHKPYGVILAISPFNFPVNLAITKFIPALLTGNAVIFKSATNGCLTGARLTELIHEIGLPAGVFNNVTGRGSIIGNSLIQNENVSGISFTGSSAVGNTIAKMVSKIPIILEMGGKCPVILRKDADLDLAISKIMLGGFAFSGQRCTAIKRIIVHESIKDELIVRLNEKVRNLSIGKAMDNRTITAVINQKATNFIKSLVEDAEAKGANFNGYKFEAAGNLIKPMVISDVTNKMRLYYEEQFGPIMPIITYQTDEEAINIANDSVYGLQTSIFTSDIDLAMKMAVKIHTGSVNFNSFPQSGPMQLPFIGVKDSGFRSQGIPYSIKNMRREFNIVENN